MAIMKESGPIDKYRRWLTSPWPFFGAWQQQRAIQALRENGSSEAVQLLAGAAWRGDHSDLRRAAVDALRHLAQRHNIPAQEALCRYVLHHQTPLLQEVREAGYLPKEESQRALLYFLTEQWDEYDRIDFDHSLLRTVYEAGTDQLRRRIAAVARDAGRIEWVGIASGGRQGRRLAAMTDGEWKAAMTVLYENERWEDMWKLAQAAPPRWSAPLLRRLKTIDWFPAGDERPSFAELVRLADQFHEADFRHGIGAKAVLQGHTDEVRCLAFSANGQILASGSADKTVRLWSVAGERLLNTLEGHRGPVNCLAISPDGRSLVSGGKDGTGILWNLPSAKTAIRLKGHDQMILCLAISPDGRVLATGSADSVIQLWSLPDGQSCGMLDGHSASVLALAVSPDSRTLASAGGDATVRLWSLPDGKALRTLRGHRDDDLDAVLCLAISPDGRVLASGGTDHDICLWSLPGGQPLATLEGHLGQVASLAFGTSDQLLASGSGDQTIRLWRVNGGRPVECWDAHASEVTRLIVSPDGALLASASGGGLGLDHGVRLWSLNERKWIKTLNGHTRYVSCVAFSPDGRYLASGGGDSTIRLWTSELTRLSYQPVRQATLKDLKWAQDAGRASGVPASEKSAWAFIAALIRRRRRHDVELGDAVAQVIEVGAFDIEIEG
jgi:WD40 repeat protein